MNFQNIISDFSLIESIFAVIIALIPIIIGFIRVWNTTHVELLLVPLHKRVLHDFNMSIIVSFMMIGAIAVLSVQAYGNVSTSITSVIGLVSFSIFLICFTVILIHALITTFRSSSGKNAKVFRGFLLVGYISVLATLISMNALLLEDNSSLTDMLPIFAIQLGVLFVSNLGIPFYIKNLNRAGVYYEVEMIRGEEKEELLKKMVLINSIQSDIQVLTSLSENPEINPNSFPVYVYYVQTDVLEKISKKKHPLLIEN
ncbi:hypothetical protein ACTHQ4_20095 [Alkalicoccobacillus gibsonii]|uniref:hypothetical protein n=1 Tax=Alkalicoccobacillus gibsonii TaxID=79881 RepID=UPI003F7B3D9C